MTEKNTFVNPKKTLISDDPNDKSLRKIEKDVLIPKLVREKSQTEKCAAEVGKFHECTKKNGLSMVFFCRKENNEMKECLKTWFFNKNLIEECTQEYLRRRSEFRATGLGAKDREMKPKLERLKEKRPDLFQ